MIYKPVAESIEIERTKSRLARTNNFNETDKGQGVKIQYVNDGISILKLESQSEK
jgi:hypothetical protein